jgi:hypothetical protein
MDHQPGARGTLLIESGLKFRCATVERWEKLWKYRESFQMFELREGLCIRLFPL